MDWSDERYIRVYTRDTVTWENLEWEGQTVFLHLLRKVDRAGVLEFSQEDGAEAAVKAVTRLPLHVIEPGLARCLKRGVVEVEGSTLVIPKFIEAQEAHQSDKQRMKEYRARRRDLARHASVTERNASESTSGAGAETPSVTNRNPPVSSRNDSATPRRQIVTPSLAMPSLAMPSSDPAAKAAASDAGASTRNTPPAAAQEPESQEPESEPYAPPIRKPDLLVKNVTAAGYVPMPEHETFALGLGLTRSEYQKALGEVLNHPTFKGYASPAKWDSRLVSFIESAARSRRRSRPTPAPTSPASGDDDDDDFSHPTMQRLMARGKT